MIITMVNYDCINILSLLFLLTTESLLFPFSKDLERYVEERVILSIGIDSSFS